jgi:menaquinone-dependent protoporphyrinogen oxidase
MKFLILYGTTEGQTRKVAQFAAQHISSHGHDALLFDAVAVPPEIDIHDFDGVLVAASLHLGRYQPAVVDFVHRHIDKIDRKPNAFISVSLAALSQDQDEIEGLRDCVRRFTEETRWTPGHLHHAAGAFRFTAYDFFRRWAMKYIAHKHGIAVEPGQDREFTDWRALGQFLDEFIAGTARPALEDYPETGYLDS